MTALGDFTAGDVLQASDLNAIGAWTAFTPSWNNFTVGNGTQDFAYCLINNVMLLNGFLTLCTTSVMGSNPSFNLPASKTVQRPAIAGVTARDFGVATRLFYAVPVTGSTTIGFSYWTPAGSVINNAAVSATTPWTWANGDYIRISIVMEVD